MSDEFEVIGDVTVPTLRVGVDKAVFVYVRDAIVRERKEVALGDDEKVVHVLPIVDMSTGQKMNLIAGIVLVNALEKYKGGNFQYVGRGFRLIKADAPAGKAKMWDVKEVSISRAISEKWIVEDHQEPAKK